MATYKVIQDIEAEDKLVGPLTLRQFIYAAIACICLYLSFIAITKGAAFMVIILGPIAITGGFFAFPWKGEQPTEIWALAKIRFLIKPRKRIWDQSGVKELVTITAPKQVHVEYTNGLSETEVRSRLRALADTIDSRGWAIKNASINMYAQPALVMSEPTSDRLLGPSTFPQDVETADIVAADDMLDERNNRVAQQMDNMIEASARAHRQKIMETLNKPEPPKVPEPPKRPANNYWFLNQAGQSASVPNDMVTFNTQVVTPGVTGNATPAVQETAAEPLPDERALVETLEARKRELPMTAYYGHLHTIQPLSAQHKQGTPPQAQDIPATAQAQTAVNSGQPGMPAMSFQPAIPTAPSPPAQPPPTPPQNSGTPAGAAAQPQPVTPAQQAAILQLASNDDLNVATIAREAQRSGLSDGEVVIKLH